MFCETNPLTISLMRLLCDSGAQSVVAMLLVGGVDPRLARSAVNGWPWYCTSACVEYRVSGLHCMLGRIYGTGMPSCTACICSTGQVDGCVIPAATSTSSTYMTGPSVVAYTISAAYWDPAGEVPEAVACVQVLIVSGTTLARSSAI